MLGDTAVAVHPDDERYKDLIGKTVVLPLVGREIPIIADEYADPEKGSGAVKITPAHDFNDYQVYKRHPEIGLINIFDAQGAAQRARCRRRTAASTASSRASASSPTWRRGPARQDRAHGARRSACPARRRRHRAVAHRPVVRQRGRAGQARHRGGRETARPSSCRRTGRRPTSSGCATSSPGASRARSGGATRSRPGTGPTARSSWRNSEEAAHAQARAHYATAPSSTSPRLRGEGRGEGQPHTAAQVSAPHPSPFPVRTGRGSDVVLTRDEDVLDTWFSSALWPFSTLGWPDTDEGARSASIPPARSSPASTSSSSGSRA